ncbi:MAG: Phospho-N-acetylmuramoyl-pentapeptide-transferase [Parcubacteria group bacterium GW2011_GWA1_59_11]|nr:MAG: Phospho-N-acetylmuramoyl-pentapeptide-transferase [Parcubacteria group bacterium GW2011_GWA1_59_11]
MTAAPLFLIVKMLTLFILSFGVALASAPFLIRMLYKHKAWKKKPREETFGGEKTPIFTALHGEKEVSTPRMGGILIWSSVLIVTGITYLLSVLFPDTLVGKLNFVSRPQTWLPLFTLVSASLLGLIDDVLVIKNKGGYVGGGIRFKVRLALISLIGLLGAWWFYVKLEWSTLYIPFYGNLEIDGLYILLFLLVVLATFSSGVVDGLDGLSAGVLSPIFLAYGVIAWSRGLYDLTALIVVIIGALITYLWFNVHPARFYMGETGIMGLTVTLAVIAFLTNSVFFLPVIAFVLVLESASVIIQLLSKRLLGRKIFLSAPIHHHLQALGWPESQVTMRFWIISSVSSAFGLVIYFLARFL